MKRDQGLSLLFILANVFIAIGFALIVSYQEQNYSYIILGIGVILFIVLAIIMTAQRLEPKSSFQTESISYLADKQRKKSKEIYRQRVEQALQKALGKQENMSISEDLSVNVYTGNLDDDVCMVCKLFLNEQDEILQCPICESLYHRDHLLEWVKVEKRCPVCSQVLYKKARGV